jgi:crotonobetainyl-CoA:carnitine CoA-transferase CaiB-like acyl-CoA transferase
MKSDENKPTKASFALVGFVTGVLTVVLVLLALKGC